MKKAYLILNDGHIFEGLRFGAEGDALGELVFNTSMCGYVETISDPSYYGQIVMQTFPLIGNYGVMQEDMQSDRSVLRGYVVREWCTTPSNFRAEGDIDTYLKEKGVVGLYGVDTRQITRIIRDSGVMNAKIVDTLPQDPVCGLEEYTITKAVPGVSVKQKTVHEPSGCNAPKHTLALIDYGVRRDMLCELQRRGCRVIQLPYDVTAEEVLALHADGVVLSNGPGNPAENTLCIDTLKKLTGKIPMFGICLGHQLLALAHGGHTQKLKYGHRGANQPVKCLGNGRVYITNQNHGYTVLADSMKGKGEISFINAHDGTCEGIDYPDQKAFSVQFYPETCGGPQDSVKLFDRFITMTGGKDYAAE
ncbi:MAG: carbamoyl phosphate synthase small subunit [Christensenellales bacterium]|jgi:carbamoyl-phosphate synthase small subunit